MSESSNITNGNGSGSSWTVLTPEESVGSVGPGVGGNESLAASHGTAEEGTGEAKEMERGDHTAQTEGSHSDQGLQEPAVENIGTEAEGNRGFTDTPDLPGVTESIADPTAGGRRAVQTDGARSEEGLQVCQETGSSQGSAPPSPTILSPSPPSNISLSYNFQGYTQSSNEPDIFSDTYTHISSSPESHVAVGPCPESVVSFPTPPSQGRDGLEHEEEESEISNKITEVGKQAESPYDSELGVGSGTEGEGLRKRKTLSLGPLDQVERDGDEEVEEEQRRPRDGEDGGGITLNKCILGALILLGLGTILFSAEDVDVRELSDTELHGNKEQLNSDTEPQGGQEMAELLDKLAKENQQINELQSRLQSQEEELSLALQQAEEKGREIARNGELEKENERMKEELASLPALQSELESLRARVMELTLLTAKEESQQGPASPSEAPSSGHTENNMESPAVEEATGATEESDPLREELERQKVLLDGSRKRLEGMKVEAGGRRGVREGLADMERRLTEEVEKLGKRAGDRRKRSWEGGNERWDHGKEWKGDKDRKRRNGLKSEGGEWKERGGQQEWSGEKDQKDGSGRGREADKVWRGKEERKEWKGEKDWKKDRNGGRSEGKEWKEKKEWRGEKNWKQDRDGERGQSKEWKEREERKRWEEKEKGWHKDGERKKDGWKEERKNEEWKRHNKHDDKHNYHKNDKEHRNKWEGMAEPKEMAKKERHWRGTPDKTPLKPSHRHHEHNDYWKRKKEKLQHFYRPLVACIGIAECAKMEGLTPVRLADFEALLGGYLSKIDGAEAGGKEEISKLVKEFFVDGVFTHDKISFRDFVEDVADILEDMVEGDGEDDDAAEDEMEEFEKDALRKFSVTGGEEKVDTNGKK